MSIKAEQSDGMSNQAKVTVWIPSYNHARFLPSAIESVLAQTYPSLELIIVDDGSTDGSLQLAESYAAKHPSLIKVFTHAGHRNMGISATVNLAFEKSTGEFVSGLPSDDVIYPDKLQKQVAFLERHASIGWVYGGVHYINEAGERIPDAFGVFRDISHEPRGIEQLIKKNVIPGMTVLARRECFEKTGPHNEALIYSDWDYWIRMLAHWKVGYINHPLVMYRVHKDNTALGVDFDENVKHGLAVLASLSQQAEGIGGTLNQPRARALIDLQQSLFLFFLNRDKAAVDTFRSALQIDPALAQDVSYLRDWLKTSWGGYGFAKWVIEQIGVEVGDEPANRLDHEMSRWLTTRAALDKRQKGDLKCARNLALRSLTIKPYTEDVRLLAALLLETLIGTDTMGRMRRAKDRFKDRHGKAAYP